MLYHNDCEIIRKPCIMITSAQMRAARALAGVDQRELAKKGD
jgi:hypothetical protein